MKDKRWGVHFQTTSDETGAYHILGELANEGSGVAHLEWRSALRLASHCSMVLGMSAQKHRRAEYVASFPLSLFHFGAMEVHMRWTMIPLRITESSFFILESQRNCGGLFYKRLRVTEAVSRRVYRCRKWHRFQFMSR